eukprot:11056393-Alexandrium_andersonii.AAC.1
MSASLVGSEMCIRDRDSLQQRPPARPFATFVVVELAFHQRQFLLGAEPHDDFASGAGVVVGRVRVGSKRRRQRGQALQLVEVCLGRAALQARPPVVLPALEAERIGEFAPIAFQ